MANHLEKKEGMQKKVVGIVVTVGAVLIGAGIFSFVASNWRNMDKSVKIALIVVAIIASATSHGSIDVGTGESAVNAYGKNCSTESLFEIQTIGEVAKPKFSVRQVFHFLITFHQVARN